MVFKVLTLLAKIFLCYAEYFYRLIIPKSEKDIKGKVVLVTGGGRGVGRELCLEFARRGAKVVSWDLLKDGNDATAAEINNQGGFARSYLCDVTKVEDIRRVAERVRKDVGDVDILVNNAGILHCGDILSVEESTIRRTFEVNILAHFWTVKEFLPKMLESNSGHIVSIASMAGKFGTEFLTEYSASKHAVVGFTQALHMEMERLGKDKIKTTTVCPMFINTDLIRDKDYSPGKLGVMEPDEVARKIVQGVLREQLTIYLPEMLRFSLFIGGLMPEKASNLLAQNGETHFNLPSKKTD